MQFRKSRPVRVLVSIVVRADPETACRVLGAWQDWPRTFSRTIAAVSPVTSAGEEQVLRVAHKSEGPVINILEARPDGTLRLREFKRSYDADFTFRSYPHPSGSVLRVHASVLLKGWLACLRPLAAPVVRARIRKYLLEPVRRSAELGLIRPSPVVLAEAECP
jgi:hypothetical protein